MLSNFPVALQPTIQQGYLERDFQDALRSITGFRDVADRETFRIRIGETVTKTRPGLKAPATTPISPAANTNLDNGLTPSTFTVEQYMMSLAMYGDTIDLNMVTEKVGIIPQFLQNAKTNGIQAAQTLDRLARNALYGAYLTGNSIVRTTLGSAAATVAVDDIRGFLTVLSNGQMQPVSSTYPMSVNIGSNSYSLVGATADGTNVSSLANWGGISGTLTCASNVTVADGTAGNSVNGAFAPTVLRPNGRTASGQLLTTDGLTMSIVLDAVAQLRRNAVPTIDGFYNCYLDPISARQLFSDNDFKLLYQGATGASQAFRMGQVIEMLDVRFIPTTEVPLQKIGNVWVHRPIVVGAGALVEGDFEGMAAEDVRPANAIIHEDDSGVVQVTREPLDRLGQIIAQSWYWIGGFAVPTDFTANQNIIPTATNAYLKRAVVIELGAAS